MSTEIITEARFLLESVSMGILFFFVYDLIGMCRSLIKHNPIAEGIEDIAFWITAAVLSFDLLLRYNNGIIRWFVILGTLGGMIIYYLAFGWWLSDKLTGIIKRVFSPILSKIRALFVEISHKGLKDENKKVIIESVDIEKKGDYSFGFNKKKKN